MKTATVALVIAAAAVIASLQSPAPVSGVGIMHPCSSWARVSGTGPYILTSCPQGDGDRLADIGARITLKASAQTGQGIPGIIPSDIWVIGCNDDIDLCGGSGAVDADSMTNSQGITTISGIIAAGGCDTGLQVILQGTIIKDPNDCVSLYCLPIRVISVDYNKDLVCDLIDFSIFGPAFPSPPEAYDACLDYNGDGVIDLIDFSIFGGHFLHNC